MDEEMTQESRGTERSDVTTARHLPHLSPLSPVASPTVPLLPDEVRGEETSRSPRHRSGVKGERHGIGGDPFRLRTEPNIEMSMKDRMLLG